MHGKVVRIQIFLKASTLILNHLIRPTSVRIDDKRALVSESFLLRCMGIYSYSRICQSKLINCCRELIM